MRFSELEDLCEAGKIRFINELSKRLDKHFTSNLKSLKTLSKDDLKNIKVNEFSDDLVSLSQKIFAGALLLGFTHAENKIALADVAPLPFEEAIDFLKAKVPMTKDEWLELEPKLRFRAFTVARLAELDQIERMKNKLANKMKEGKSFVELWDSVKQDFPKMNAGYFETVYRTNIQSAYSAGRLMQYQNNEPPAWELLVIEDGRTSDTCKGFVSQIGNGHALASNHSFWKTVGFPPYHFNCRTSFRAVYDFELKNGTTELVTTPIENIRFKPQKGFGGNPLEKGNWWMLTKGQIERGIKYGIIGEFNRTENVIADYDELWKGYTRHKGKKGGWYDLCSDLPDDWKENKSAVEALAEAGYKVKVIPEIKNVKDNYGVDWSNPDVFINALLYDVKKPKKMTSNAVKSRIASAWKKQRLTRAVLNVPNEMPEDILMIGIRRQANDDNNKITDIILIYKGNIKELKMADFRK